MKGERFGGYRPERALPSPDRVNLDTVTGFWEGAVQVGLRGADLDMVVRDGLVSLIRADLRIY